MIALQYSAKLGILLILLLTLLLFSSCSPTPQQINQISTSKEVEDLVNYYSGLVDEPQQTLIGQIENMGGAFNPKFAVQYSGVDVFNVTHGSDVTVKYGLNVGGNTTIYQNNTFCLNKLCSRYIIDNGSGVIIQG